MSVALRGNLEDFGIADVFQLIGQQRKTGILEFTGPEGHVQLRFDRGAVVSAAPVGSYAEEALADMLIRCGRLDREQLERLLPECEASAQTAPRLAVSRGWLEVQDLERIEDLLTRETFFRVLRWRSGAFDFRAQPVDHARRFESLLGAEQILMDGLRMVDEWQSFGELVPDEETIFRRVAGFEEYRQRTRLDARQLQAAERIFQLVDGRMSVRRIIDHSLLGTFDAVRLLADLRRSEVIEPLDAESMSRLRASVAPRIQVDGRQALGWLMAALALLALAAVAHLAQVGAPPVIPLAGLEIPRSEREQAVSAWGTRRMRNALETHRFAHGRWPQGLEDLESNGLVTAGALATSQGRPYYYRQRDDGAVLLAPER